MCTILSKYAIYHKSGQKRRKIMIKIVKVNKILDHYLNVYCEEEGLKSMDANTYNVKALKKGLGNKNIRYLDDATIKKYRRKRLKAASKNTVRRELSILRTALREGIEEEIIKGTVVIEKIENLKIKNPKKEKRKYVPRFSEVDEIFKELPEYLKTFCQGCIYTGYRRGELEKLTFSDIDFDYKEIRIDETKTDSPRYTTMFSELYQHMVKQRDEARKIFGVENVSRYPIYLHDDKKQPIIRGKTDLPWKKAVKAAGCIVQKNGKDYHKYTVHDLRKHAIKFLRQKKGFDRDIIRDMFTGHKDKLVFELIYNIATNDDKVYNRKIVLAA